MKTALTLSGSIRQGSHNLKLQAHLGRQLEAAGVSVNAINLGDFDLPIFSEDLEAEAVPQGAVALAELWRSHDIIFITSHGFNGQFRPFKRDRSFGILSEQGQYLVRQKLRVEPDG